MVYDHIINSRTKSLIRVHMPLRCYKYVNDYKPLSTGVCFYNYPSDVNVVNVDKFVTTKQHLPEVYYVLSVEPLAKYVMHSIAWVRYTLFPFLGCDSVSCYFFPHASV